LYIIKNKDMQNEIFRTGQVVKYSNGNHRNAVGTIVKILPNQLVIIDDSQGFILWNAGYSVGDCIAFSQVHEITKTQNQ
jgi:hypothetical protein